MKMLARFAGLVTLAVAAGCGGPGSFSGTVAGQKLDVKSAVYLDAKDSNGNLMGTELLLTDQDNICTMLKGGHEPKGLTAFGLVTMSVDATGNVVTPASGTYTVIDPSTNPSSAGNYAIAVFVHLDSSCANTISGTDGSGKSGTVKLDGLTLEKSANGSFDVTMGSSDHVTGSFNAQFCDFNPSTTVNCG